MNQTQLRKSGKPRERESELGVTSDRRVGKPRERVRSWSNLGQEKRKTGRESLNLVQLRTEEMGIQGE